MKNIGFIGLGKMGHPMAERLQGSYNLFVYNRTRKKATDLIDKGATWENTPKEIAEASEIVVIMVADNEACHDVLMNETGVFAAENSPVIVNMSTITPQASKKFAETADETGFGYIEAPVSGTVGPAKKGTLTIIAAPEGSMLTTVKPLLENFGNSIFTFKKIGQASVVKLLVNLNLAVQTAVLSETLNISKTIGVDQKEFLEVVNNSAVSTVISKVKGPNMISSEFPTAFPYRHMIKDLTYGMSIADDIPMPLVSLTKEIYLLGRDLGNKDFSAILELYNRL